MRKQVTRGQVLELVGNFDPIAYIQECLNEKEELRRQFERRERKLNKRHDSIIDGFKTSLQKCRTRNKNLKTKLNEMEAERDEARNTARSFFRRLNNPGETKAKRKRTRRTRRRRRRVVIT